MYKKEESIQIFKVKFIANMTFIISNSLKLLCTKNQSGKEVNGRRGGGGRGILNNING